VVKRDSVLRAFFALLTGMVFAGSGWAQSELYFPSLGGEGHFSLTNPSDSFVEVEFSRIGLDGVLQPGPINPVRYEIPTHGELSMSVEEVFAGPVDDEGWVRVTSTTSGIGAMLFAGGSNTTFEGIPAVTGYADQIVFVPDRGQGAIRELRIINPSGSSASLNVTIWNSAGVPMAVTSDTLEADSGLNLNLAELVGPTSELLTARLSSSVPLAAQARIIAGDAEIVLSGQPASSGAASSWVAPHVLSENGFNSTLILSNPTGLAVTVTVTLFNEDGGPVHVSQSEAAEQTVTIPSNGTVSLGAVQLAGLPFVPNFNGWLEVVSPNVPLATAVVISQGTSASAYPLQSASISEAYYPRLMSTADRSTSLALTNLGAAPATVELVLVDINGNTVARTTEVVQPTSKQIAALDDSFGSAALEKPGWLAVVSTANVRSIAIVSESGGRDLSTVQPQVLAPTTVFEEVPSVPTLEPLLRFDIVEPGDRLTLIADNVGRDAVVVFGDLVVEPVFLGLFRRVIVDVPEIEPGYVDVRLRNALGEESEPVSLLVGPLDTVPLLRDVESRAFYQKLVSGPDGLELERPVLVPIRGARVEVYSQLTGAVFSVGTTDQVGHYRVPAPESEGYAVRVLSMVSPDGVIVADNTAGSAIYSIGTMLDGEQTAVLLASDADRVSGAFNIFEVMRRANRLLIQADPELPLPGLAIFWSQRNTRLVGDPALGAIGGTFFDTGNNTAFVLGDREVDSDEFDDSVLLHEYAHMLAARFSRDDSFGGPHVAGDVLDPRVAWSEGWANFFSALVLGDSIYRDTFDVGGAVTLEYDLDVNFVPGDAGGYWSEFSVHSLLWDLVDIDGAEGDDVLELGFDLIWQAFRAMADDVFVYAPTFLDRLTVIEGVDTALVEQLARSRTIDYLTSADPTVSNPFPRLISENVPVTGELDSISRQRGNLAQSAHLYAFDSDGGAVSIRLNVTGLGPASNALANDLDLFLMDGDGRVIARSDRGLNGQSELISKFLPAGRYVVEVRSYYTRAETGTLIFNSGAYRLSVLLP
jgi:hypothetical protein